MISTWLEKMVWLLALVVVGGGAKAAGVTRPNILIIVADDLGYADLGVQGASDLRTPNIDSLAVHGVRCTDGYVTNPLCAPSRAALLTGRYQQRFGFEYNPGDESEAPANFGIPQGELVLAERLKKAGYATLAVGKWHLGYRPELQPRQRGFDGFYGHLDGAHHYMNNEDGGLVDNGERIEGVTYTTTMFGEKAASFVGEHREGPWFVYLAFSAVHGRIRAPGEYLERFAEVPEVKRRTLAAMMGAMDDAVGRVLETLRSTGQMERTLIVFLSDNGGLPRVNASLNAPFRGQKGDLLEGGIRVPFLMQWPDGLPQGVVYGEPVCAIDVVPTALAAAGIPTGGEFDGVNLLPYVSGREKGAPHESLYWRAEGAAGWAIRQDGWKLLYNEKEARAKVELFDLKADPGEKTDLAAQNPERVSALRSAWEKWNAGNIAPLWGRKKEPRKNGKPEE